MNPTPFRIFHGLVLLSLLGVLLNFPGCGGEPAAQMMAEVNDLNIKRVSSLYAVYQGQHNFKGPTDEAELKTFIAQQDATRLKNIGVDPAKLDKLFVSERDKQPFKIRWGLTSLPRQGPIPIVFEQAGSDGKFMVAFSSYICKEVEQVEYDRLWAGTLDQEPADANRGGPPD